MTDYDNRLANYIPVSERIEAFYVTHPEGVLQSEIVSCTETRVIVKGYAYRTADDSRPGIGHSSCPIPGLTPYTKNSEVENAETSAWGRAIAALGFEVKRGIATRHDIEMKQGNADTQPPRPAVAAPYPVPDDRQDENDPITPQQRGLLEGLAKDKWGETEGLLRLSHWMADPDEPWLNCSMATMTKKQFQVLVTRVTMWSAASAEADDNAGNLWDNESQAPPSDDIDRAFNIVNASHERVRQQHPNAENLISDKQAKRLFAIAKGNKDVLKQVLETFGLERDRDIPRHLYERICEVVQENVQ